MNLVVLVFVLVLFSALFSPSANAKPKRQKVKLSTAGKIYVPKQIKSFKLVHTKKYPNKELGVSFEYKSEDVPVKYDYYIYPVDENTSIEFSMIKEYGNILYGIKYYAKKDEGVFSLLDSKIITIGERKVISTITHIENQGMIYVSELYLTVINNHFIKLRATFPISDNKKYNLRKETKELYENLIKQTQFKSKDKSEFIVNLDSSFIKDDESLLKFAMMYGISVKAHVGDDLIVGFDDFVSIFEKTVLIIKEVAKTKQLDVFSLKDAVTMFEVYDAGFLNEVVWLGFKQDYWQKPESLQIDALQQWLEAKGTKNVKLRPDGVEVLIKR